MKKKTILGLSLLLMATACTQKEQKASVAGEPEVTVAVVSDLHFDMPPETDQFHHVVAVNKLGEQTKIDAVLQLGDLFDQSAPEIHALYRERWECNHPTPQTTKRPDAKTTNYPVYPLYGNHDIEPSHGRPAVNKAGYELNMQYLDSLLAVKKDAGELLNVDAGSRAYSFNLGGVHFVMVTLAAGDTTYCKSNMEWLAEDLKTYCADGTPLVYCQHYGFDDWALDWWTPEQRRELEETLKPYRLAAFLVGHTHSWSVQQFAGFPVLQVNNAWADEDGPASFCLLKIKGDDVTIETYNVLDGEGTTKLISPVLHQTIPINQ